MKSTLLLQVYFFAKPVAKCQATHFLHTTVPTLFHIFGRAIVKLYSCIFGDISKVKVRTLRTSHLGIAVANKLPKV